MKKILVVEDDDFFRSAVRSILGDKFEVLEAPNGKKAREILSMMKLDLVLSDIQMPYFNGVELLEWVQKNDPNLPVILMTGFSQILETRKAYDLGAQDFLPKPFQAEDLVQRVNKVLKIEAVKSDKPLTDPAKDFCRVPIEDFVTEKDTEYGVFIRVSPEKFIKIAHRGGKISEDKIRTFKEKGVHHLYVKKEDFASIVGFTINLSKAINGSPLEREKKLRFMEYTGSLLMQKAFLEIDQSVLNDAKTFLGSNIEMIGENSDCLEVLSQLSQHTDHLYAHSVGVSMIALIIAKGTGIRSPQTLFKVAMAGLFHDIGYKEISSELVQRPRHLLTEPERSLLETHPARGKAILEGIKGIPSEVIQITYEHHEDILGTGFPRRLDKARIHPLTHLIYLADAYCNLVLKSSHSLKILSGREAIRWLESTKSDVLDPAAFAALKKVILSAPAAEIAS